MRKSSAIVVGLLVSFGATSAAALTVPSPMFGSDSLFNLTVGAISGAGLTPTTAYVGGGSGAGTSAMANRTAANATQLVGPATKMLTSTACQYGLASGAAGANTTNASGIVIGLDAVDILASTTSGSNAACNGTSDGTGTGLAYSGSAVFGAGGNATSASQNWKYILALVYGGKDITTGVVDCGQPARQNLVNNWSTLFQNGCTNPAANVCGDANHTVAGGGANVLWHAFRRDDASATSDVFASLLGLSPSTSQTANNGFGTSPYCNALNWDATTANDNGTACSLGAHDQWTGPGGIPDPSSTTTPAHRRPPPGTWGDAPDSTQTTNGADVLPTDMQDNDPIRRPCIGGSTGSAARPAEEVCNLDGKLGLVLVLPSTDFIPKTLSPLVQYPTAACTGAFAQQTPLHVFTCAPFNTRVHFGQCANGDALFGGNCAVPLNGVGAPGAGTSQCFASSSTRASLVKRDGTVPPTSVNALTAEGRAFNLHLFNGSNADGVPGYVEQIVQTGTSAPLSRDLVGGYGRIHTVATIFAKGGTPTTVGCQMVTADDQVGCLAAADPCSIGFASDGGKGWNTRPDGNLTPPSSVFGALTDAIRVAQVYPQQSSVQLLGIPAVASGIEYQMSRKLYLNSIIGFANIAPTTADPATGELALAQYESNAADITPLLTASGFFTNGPQSAQLGVARTGGTANAPFCEDFNQTLVCANSALVNDNACARNPPGIPSDPSAVPTGTTTSTVCGNGKLEALEECDNGTPGDPTTNPVNGGNGSSGNNCSTTCRCAGATSFVANGSGGYICQ
jgi:hypothetical protein